MKIGKESNWRARMNRLHHQLVRNADVSDEVFNSIVGKDAWSVVEQWSDHPEAQQLITDQEIGEVAIRDRWDQQIYTLQAEKEKINTQFSELVKVNELKDKEIADLKSKAAAQSDDTVQLNKLGEFFRWAIKRLGTN